VFTLLHWDYNAVCPAASVTSATTTDREWQGKRGDEVVGAPGREAFIKLALSQHRAIIAEWITSSHPGSHAALVPLSSISFLCRFVFRFIFLYFFFFSSRTLSSRPFLRVPHFRYSVRPCMGRSFSSRFPVTRLFLLSRNLTHLQFILRPRWLSR